MELVYLDNYRGLEQLLHSRGVMFALAGVGTEAIVVVRAGIRRGRLQVVLGSLTRRV
jgi:hypothetical protein